MTDEEKQAAAEPRVGDVWERQGETREVTKVRKHHLMWVDGCGNYLCCRLSYWLGWCHEANLLKRGDE